MNNNSNPLEEFNKIKENEYIEYNKKMEIVYNALKFDYLVQVSVNELNELNKLNQNKEIKEINEFEPPQKVQRKH